MKFRSKALRILGVLAVTTAMILPAACGSSACAASAYSSYSSGGSRSYSPPSNSGSRSFSSGGSRTYSPPSNSGSRSTYSKAPSNSGSRSSGSVGGSSIAKTRTFTYSGPGSSRTYSLPSTINSRTWRSPQGGTVYVYHVHSYYHQGGYHNLWNPYDWTNYYNPLSPWYQRSGAVAYGQVC